MLRALILVLLLANLGYFSWTQGWLDPVTGTSPLGDREPERLARQVSPDAVRVLPPQPTASGSGNGAERLACLEIGPFAPAQVPAVEAVLAQVLPPGAWAATPRDVPAVWTVYMGRFANREALERKLDELGRLKLPYEEVTAPAELAPGVSLGRFADRAAADKALGEFAQRGVRTARTVELTPVRSEVHVRVAEADPGMQARLASVRDAALLGKTFTPCSPDPSLPR